MLCDHCGKSVSEDDAVRPGLGVGHGMTLHESCLMDMVDAYLNDSPEGAL